MKHKTYYGFSWEYGIYTIKPTTKEHIIEAFGDDSFFIACGAEIPDDCYTAIVNGKVFAINQFDLLLADLRECGINTEVLMDGE